MTDHTAQDIAAWLDRAMTKADADADRWHDAECSFHGTTLIDMTVLQGGATLCDCEGPASVRRRCAADRKLLELHAGRAHSCPVWDDDGDYDQRVDFYDHETCPVVQLLAEGYGWQPET
ncbi:hypothetical protein DMH12_24840 [Streptomyces sp. WAC 04229]|uniref:hypothetical protein n=1 Tax=Streptomyces sp. WAC 04229 TaxID=2203206 RepID=UPI000F741B50|nr:hypothetical protein [Streptomyces sp. WAC 04229]RSN50512.1 hypothetical protein DMH12_24840 [Streptomyces sp. WAC 04229]